MYGAGLMYVEHALRKSLDEQRLVTRASARGGIFRSLPCKRRRYGAGLMYVQDV